MHKPLRRMPNEFQKKRKIFPSSTNCRTSIRDNKKTMGFCLSIVERSEKNKADFGLIFSAYNLRRILSILGIDELNERLGGVFLLLSRLWLTIMNHARKIYSNQCHTPPLGVASKRRLCGGVLRLYITWINKDSACSSCSAAALCTRSKTED